MTPLCLLAAAVVSQAPAQWSGTAGLSLISLSGNASTLVFNGTASAKRELDPWKLGVKAFGTYGQARPADDASDPQVIALAAGIEFRGDRNLTEKTAIFALAGIETNHLKSIEEAPYAELGAATTWLERKDGDFVKLSLSTDLALRFQREFRFQYYPVPMDIEDRDAIGPRVGVRFRWAPSKDVIFTQDVDAAPNVIGKFRLLVSATSKLTAKLTQSIAFAASFKVDHDSDPAPGKKPTDTALTAGVEVAF